MKTYRKIATCLCFVLFLLTLCFVDYGVAFTPVSRHLTAQRSYVAPSKPVNFSQSTFSPSSALYATRSVNDGDDDDEDENEIHDEAWLKRELEALERDMKRGKNNRGTRAVGPGRAGGRTRRQKQVSTKSKEDNNLWNSWFVKAGVPLLAVALIVRAIFAGDGGGGAAANPSYFYYQSSYYSSISTVDGNVQRTYKQSIKSNVPSLVEGKRLLQQQQDNTPTRNSESSSSQYLLRESPDRGLDQELDQALIRVQQAMFNDWY